MRFPFISISLKNAMHLIFFLSSHEFFKITHHDTKIKNLNASNKRTRTKLKNFLNKNKLMEKYNERNPLACHCFLSTNTLIKTRSFQTQIITRNTLNRTQKGPSKAPQAPDSRLFFLPQKSFSFLLKANGNRLNYNKTTN